MEDNEAVQNVVQLTTQMKAQLGASLSDLVAHVYALSTEDEHGDLLKQRLIEIRAFANSIVERAKIVAQLREGKYKP